MATPTGYHYQPVACAWIALIRAAFGENPTAFQVVGLLQLVCLCFFTYHLGCRLLRDRGTSFLASLLVLGSASFYEASYWPLAGNMHLLAAQLYVLTVILAHDTALGRFGRGGPWLVGLSVLAAIFSHPAMITAIPVCAWTMFVVCSADTALRCVSLRRIALMLMPLVVVGILFGLSRVAFAPEVSTAPRPSLDPMRAYWLVSRGLVAAFSLRGSDEVLHALTTLGSNVVVPGRWIWAYVGGWLLFAAGMGAIVVTRAGQPGVRILTGFLGLHLLILGVAAPMSSRQQQVPAVAAALLTAWILSEIASRLAVRSKPAPRATVRLLPALVTAFLIVGAQHDHQVSAKLHVRAADLSRSLIKQIRDVVMAAPKPVGLVLLNMPAYLTDRGIRAPAFANGLNELVRLTAPPVATVELWRVSIPDAPEDGPSESVVVNVEQLQTRLLDPSVCVVYYDPRLGPTILTEERLKRIIKVN